MVRRIAVLVGLILCCVSLNAQAPKQAVKKRLAVRAGRLIDGKSDQLITNAMVVVPFALDDFISRISLVRAPKSM